MHDFKFFGLKTDIVPCWVENLREIQILGDKNGNLSRYMLSRTFLHFLFARVFALNEFDPHE